MLKFNRATGEQEFCDPTLCSFGLAEVVAPAIAGFLGVDAATGAAIATGAVDAVAGAGVGAAGSAITGGNPLTGALTGGLTGGVVGGFGGLAGDALGIGATGGDALVGTAAGAVGSALTGGNVLTGAATGGAGGLATGLISGGLSGNTTGGLSGNATGGTGGAATPTSGVGTGGSAAGTAAPAGASAAPGASLASTAPNLTDAFSAASTGGGSSLGTDVTGSGGISGTPGVSGPPGGAGAVAPTASLATDTPNLSSAFTDSGTFGTAAQSGAGDSTFGGASSATSGIGSFLKSYGGPLIAAGGLGLDLLKGSTPVQGQAPLNTEATQLQNQGNQLSSYLQTGTLPPGVQQSITQAADQAKAAIRSRYASMGGDTSAMQQDLANVDQQAATQGATIATQLLSEGIQETGLSEQIYGQLMNQATQQNAQLGSAVGNLATALAGGGSKILLQGATT